MSGSLAKSCMALSSPVQVSQVGVILWHYGSFREAFHWPLGRLWHTTSDLPQSAGSVHAKFVGQRQVGGVEAISLVLAC